MNSLSLSQLLKPKVRLQFSFLFLLAFCCSTFAQSVVINEVMPSNSVTLVDEDGDFSDWIELYNSNSIPVNLAGFFITDDEDNPEKWIFPDVVIEPYQFITIFASGKDRYQGELHTNFKLKSSGETLLLTSSTGIELDRIVPPGLGEDISFGRIPDGENFFSQMYFSSPGFSNNENDGISFSQESGYYQEDFQLSLQAQNAASVIYYTLDGSTPNPQSILYNGAILIEDRTYLPNQFASIENSAYDFFEPTVSLFKGTVLRLQVFRDGAPVSPVVNKTYFVHPEMSTKYTLPIVSLVSDPDNFFDDEIGIYVPGVNLGNDPVWTGNYFQRGMEWEREGVFQYFDLEGNVGLEQHIGLRLHGGKSRGRQQKSFRCYARKEYGAKTVQYRLIADKDKDEFKRFTLQSPIGGWNNTLIKDVVTHEVCKELDFAVQYTQPVILFLNGEYWGIYFIRDRYDENFLEEEYGVDSDAVDILVHGSGIRPNVNEDWGVIAGDNDHYRSVMEYIEQNDMTTSASYDYFKSQVNINSLIDYYCTEIYFNNKDWPRNNHEVWRSQETESPYYKWQWLFFDIDGGWGYLGTQFNLLEYATHPTGTAWQNPPYATFLLRKLLESPLFVDDFVKRFVCLMQNEFHSDNVVPLVEEIRDWLAPEMQDHINRWNYASSVGSWNSRINSKLIGFAENRQQFVTQHLEEAFGIDLSELNNPCAPITSTEAPSILAEQVVMFPNPTQGIINIKFLGVKPVAGEAMLFDFLGKEVSRIDFKSNFELDLQTLVSGTYTLVLTSETERVVKKIIKI